MSGRVLVVYYSHSGKAKEAAETIAKRLGGDLEAIASLGPKPAGLIGFMRAGFAALRGKSWPVKPPAMANAPYDLVVLCAAVWAGRLPPPARQWLALAHDRIKSIAACGTVGGTSAPRFFVDVAEAAGKPLRAQARITEANWKDGSDAAIIDQLVLAIRRSDSA